MSRPLCCNFFPLFCSLLCSRPNILVRPGVTGHGFGSIVAADSEADETLPIASDLTNGVGQTVWMSFTATSSGVVYVSTATSDFDTILRVYQDPLGTLAGLVLAKDDNNNDDCPTIIPPAVLTSCTNVTSTAGSTFVVQVDGYSLPVPPSVGRVVVAITFVA